MGERAVDSGGQSLLMAKSDQASVITGSVPLLGDVGSGVEEGLGSKIVRIGSDRVIRSDWGSEVRSSSRSSSVDLFRSGDKIWYRVRKRSSEPCRYLRRSRQIGG